MNNKPIFKLVYGIKPLPKDTPVVFSRDTVGLRIGILYNIKSFDETKSELDPFYDTTSNNQVVLKLLYKNKIGYYYTIKLGRYYSAPTERIYLTPEEENELFHFIEEVKDYYKDKPLMLSSKSYYIRKELPSKEDFINYIEKINSNNYTEEEGKFYHFELKRILENNEEITLEQFVDYIYKDK